MGFRLWLSYMKKNFCSFIFWISIFLTAITASFHLYYEPNASVDTVDALLLLLHLDAFRKIIPLFAAFPFAAQFAKEWKSRMFDSIVYRSNVKSYATAQTVACVVSSFLVCFLGLLLFLGYARLQKPLYTGSFYPVAPYGIWLENGLPWMYLLSVSSIFSLSCTLWSMCGLALSAFFPNIYVALISPFICSYLVEHLTNQFPSYLRFFTMALGVQVLHTESGIANYLYTIFFYFVCILLVSAIFRFIVRKRVRNEIH